jgi:hypothetical protein
MRLWTMGFALVLMSSVSGCGKPKLEVDSTFDLSENFSKIFIVDAIKSEQKIQVTGTVTGAPVNVFIFLEKDKKKAENEIASGKFTPIILDKSQKVETLSLEATIPANETAIVQVNRTGIKGGSVHLKIHNK